MEWWRGTFFFPKPIFLHSQKPLKKPPIFAPNHIQWWRGTSFRHKITSKWWRGTAFRHPTPLVMTWHCFRHNITSSDDVALLSSPNPLQWWRGTASHLFVVRRLNCAFHLADALAFLHRLHIIYRDVKSENVLLDAKGCLLSVGNAFFGRSALTLC